MCSLGLLTFVLIWKCGGSFRLVHCWKPLGPPALRSSSITYGAVLHPMTISRYSPKRRCALCRGQSHSASACSLKIASNSHSSQREWSRWCPMSSILTVLWPLGGAGPAPVTGQWGQFIGKNSTDLENGRTEQISLCSGRTGNAGIVEGDQLFLRFLTGDFTDCLC